MVVGKSIEFQVNFKTLPSTLLTNRLANITYPNKQFSQYLSLTVWVLGYFIM